jgi:hypothetical protein
LKLIKEEKMSKTPKILIGLPTMGSVHTFLMVQILMWVIEAQNKGDKGISIYPTMSVQPVDNARNEIVDEFLKSDCTHLFFIDSDTIPPPEALDQLLKLDCDIATAITPIIELDQNRVNDSSGFYKRSNILGMNDELLQPDTGVQDVKAAGGSCILIKRKVLEELEKPIFRFVYKDCHPEGVSFNGSKDMMSEDYYFCAKALGKGFTMKCDTAIIAKHQKSVLW